MKRRDFVKLSAAAAGAGLLPACGQGGGGGAAAPGGGAAPAQAASAGAGFMERLAEMPEWARRIFDSDQDGIGPDGKPDPNYRATRSGRSRPNAKADDAIEMTLTQEEQDILDGKDGDVKARVLKTIVMHGSAFGADKLVDLGGNPHSAMFIGPSYIKPLIDVFNRCADAGLKSYKPYTINPRPFDLYNVETEPDEALMVFEGYTLQMELEKLHFQLGGRGLQSRSCACYLPEIGNIPKPGTYVAWAESSAVNYGNSVLGLRTNRNAAGMELLCALVGKAAHFGLMTDEGRMADWVIEVKTSKEPDWGTLGAAIGMKVTEDVPYVVGIDQYLGGKLTNENMHLLKAMGSSTAANGAVGLYHVDKITPDAVEKGKKLVKPDAQTYVVDDAEMKRITDAYPNLWSKKDAKPTRMFIGCPHLTYHETLYWGEMVTKELKKRNQGRIKLAMHLFCPNPVRDRLLDEHPELVRDMKRAGMTFTNMCAITFTGLKGFNDTEFAVTNSNKTRKYSSSRYFPDDVLLEIAMTGEMPDGV
jgi:predicted aconitase